MHIVIDPTGRFAYVANQDDNSRRRLHPGAQLIPYLEASASPAIRGNPAPAIWSGWYHVPPWPRYGCPPRIW
jgi:hypothetical protein